MSDNGGSDLDVFKTLSKAPPSARKQTLVGLQVPPPPPSAPSTLHGVPARSSAVPPPPPSIVSAAAPSATALPVPSNDAAHEAETGLDEVDEIHDVDELPSGAEHAAPDENFGEGDNTEVFQLALGEAEPTQKSNEALDRPSYLPDARAALTTSLGLPPPPPPSTLSLAPPPPPPPPSSVSLPPPAPPSSGLGNRPSYTTLNRPPLPPPSTPVRSASGGEWDDEDDKTTVYTRDSVMPPFLFGTAPARTRTVPDAPPPPMSRPSAPIPIQASATPTLQAQRVHPTFDAPASVPPGPSANRTPLLIGGLAVAVLGLVLFFLLRPATGGLVVTVAGPGNKPLDVVAVLLDGKEVCKSSPCTLKDIPAGTHMVQARADGYQETAEAAVLVTGKQDAVHNIRLVQASGTGIRISALGDGLRLSIDGREIGPLPQELSDLAPGPHVLRVEGDQFEAWEQAVKVVQDEMQVLGPLKLRVKNGLAKVVAGSNADGAKIILERGSDRRSLPELPITLEIDTSKPSLLVASRKGYQTQRLPIAFEDGAPEKTFEIALAPDEPPAAVAGPSRGWTPPARNPSVTPPPAAAAGQGTLNINSIPTANVTLDGRPLGTTPKLGISVSAGTHTVMFVKDGERHTKTVKVGAGQSQTVAHRFAK
jgi:PEGA domain